MQDTLINSKTFILDIGKTCTSKLSLRISIIKLAFDTITIRNLFCNI